MNFSQSSNFAYNCSVQNIYLFIFDSLPYLLTISYFEIHYLNVKYFGTLGFLLFISSFILLLEAQCMIVMQWGGAGAIPQPGLHSLPGQDLSRDVDLPT